MGTSTPSGIDEGGGRVGIRDKVHPPSGMPRTKDGLALGRQPRSVHLLAAFTQQVPDLIGHFVQEGLLPDQGVHLGHKVGPTLRFHNPDSAPRRLTSRLATLRLCAASPRRIVGCHDKY